MKRLKQVYNKGKDWGLSKAVGKKEKDLGSFEVMCKDCGTLTDIEDTTCPRKIKKLIKRNTQTRAMAMIALQKFNARCKPCHEKFMANRNKDEKDETELSKKEAFDIAEAAVDQYKKETGGEKK